jgi:hypothetical protein
MPFYRNLIIRHTRDPPIFPSQESSEQKASLFARNESRGDCEFTLLIFITNLYKENLSHSLWI